MPEILKKRSDVNRSNRLYRSKYPPKLIPTASTFAPITNHNGDYFTLPSVTKDKMKGFATGKGTYAPLQKKKILSKLIRPDSE